MYYRDSGAEKWQAYLRQCALVAGYCQYRRCYSNQIVQGRKMVSTYRQKKKLVERERE